MRDPQVRSVLGSPGAATGTQLGDLPVARQEEAACCVSAKSQQPHDGIVHCSKRQRPFQLGEIRWPADLGQSAVCAPGCEQDPFKEQERAQGSCGPCHLQASKAEGLQPARSPGHKPGAVGIGGFMSAIRWWRGAHRLVAPPGGSLAEVFTAGSASPLLKSLSHCQRSWCPGGVAA